MNSLNLSVVGRTSSRAGCGRAGRAAVLACSALLAASSALAQTSSLTPSSVFVQVGKVNPVTAGTVGATWDWSKQWDLGPGRLSGYTEASASYWSYANVDPGASRDRLGLFELTPVFRYRLDGGNSPWFGELGVGLTVTTKLYQSGSKRFSTAFNFGDHLGIGRNFGSNGQHEIAVRVEHYSNGSIKRPNPGETFVQLRYSYRL